MDEFSVFEAVKNRKTGKFFILLDDSIDGRYRVVNPEGEVVAVPSGLFADDVEEVDADQFNQFFTEAQLNGARRFHQKDAEEAEAKARQEEARKAAEQKRLQEQAHSRKASPQRRRTSSSRKPPTIGGIGATWTAPKLTFYRHKIHPLHDRQSFIIEVEGVGRFRMTKEVFSANFGEVLMSNSYRNDGIYSYKEIPEKALAYLIKPPGEQ